MRISKRVCIVLFFILIFGPNIFAHAKDAKLTIQQAQQLLIHHGYSPGPIDGIYGKKTKSALKKFQQDHNLPVTGILDRNTQSALSRKPTRISEVQQKSDKLDNDKDGSSPQDTRSHIEKAIASSKGLDSEHAKRQNIPDLFDIVSLNFFIVASFIIIVLFLAKTRSIERRGISKGIQYYFCKYSLEFLIPFIIVASLYSIIPVFISYTTQTISLQSLIHFEGSLARIESRLSIFKLSALQVFVVLFVIYLLGMLRLPAEKSKKLYYIFNKYRKLTRRVFIVIVLLSSFTLFGTQIGEPSKDLRVCIKTIRDGYADIRMEVHQAIADEVTYGIFIKIYDSFPVNYQNALSLPDKIGRDYSSYRTYYKSAKSQYGKRAINAKFLIISDISQIKNVPNIDPRIRFANKVSSEKAQSVRTDLSKLNIRKVKEARESIGQHRSRFHNKVITLLKLEGGKKVISQIPAILTSEAKEVLVRSWIEAIPILEPIFDVFKNTIDKDVALKVEKVAERITDSVIQKHENVEKLLSEKTSMIVEKKKIELSEIDLKKANNVRLQLEKDLAGIHRNRALIDEQVKQIKTWREVSKQGSVEAYETYLKKFPNSPYTKNAKNQLDNIWDEIAKKRSIQEWEKFREKHPNTSLARRATLEINRLFTSTLPEGPSSKLNPNLSVDVNWSSVPGAQSYRVYWSSIKGGPITKVNSEVTSGTEIKHWPNKFPVYYSVAAIRNGLESKPSRSITASLLSSQGGKQCQICGSKSIGFCHNRKIYVCRQHNIYTARSGTRWRCP